MNASSWSLRNLPRFRATLAQWRYALRNTIAMCLALTVAYYLNLDEPYWAMTSAAVVSFPTVGGVISKASDASLAVCSEPLRHCFLPDIRSMSRGFSFEHGGVAWLLYGPVRTSRIMSRMHFNWRATRLPSSPFRWLILLRPASCGISLRRAFAR